MIKAPSAPLLAGGFQPTHLFLDLFFPHYHSQQGHEGGLQPVQSLAAHCKRSDEESNFSHEYPNEAPVLTLPTSD